MCTNRQDRVLWGFKGREPKGGQEKLGKLDRNSRRTDRLMMGGKGAGVGGRGMSVQRNTRYQRMALLKDVACVTGRGAEAT